MGLRPEQPPNKLLVQFWMKVLILFNIVKQGFFHISFNCSRNNAWILMEDKSGVFKCKRILDPVILNYS